MPVTPLATALSHSQDHAKRSCSCARGSSRTAVLQHGILCPDQVRPFCWLCSSQCSPGTRFNVWEQTQIPDEVLEAALRSIF